MTSAISSEIKKIKDNLGNELAIIGHHYQVDKVIQHTDHRGDSLALASMISDLEAKHVVFCGVYFMAESAALLARDDQTIYIPDPTAECVMATMSPADLLREVIEHLSKSGRKIMPITYVNSTLAVKSVVGSYGGSVCTSANAQKILSWALDQADAILFVPDMNLGSNAAKKLGITDEAMHVLNLDNDSVKSINMSKASIAKILLWPGYCPIHTNFKSSQIEALRKENPGLKVGVHPECTPEVVAKADMAGSTTSLIKYVEDAPKGSTLAIGTEINLVGRLAEQYKEDKKIIPLVRSECEHMTQTTEEKLLDCLKSIHTSDESYIARVAEGQGDDARKALELMLKICK